VNDPAISVEHLTKRFQIPLDHTTHLKYRISHPISTSRHRELLALNDVSFEVGHGEFLGITGPNGCGKSTLLKILSRIYTADSGTVSIRERVSPFLELGVGFNPELTARENIFLGGAVLGLTRKQLVERSDRVLAFAELEDFADQKVKNFSSGMVVRLAFSVAIQADAGILLMDEVLAVGDASFQEKCFDVFSQYKRDNRTIVLVTHDLGALDRYCDRVLLLEKGRLVADGPASDVTSQYRRMVGAASSAPHGAAAIPTQRWGTREVEITGVRLLDRDGKEQHTFLTDEPMTVALDYFVNTRVDFACSLGFKRSDGIVLAGPNTQIAHHRIVASEPGSHGTISYQIPAVALLGASYLLIVGLYDVHITHAFDHIEDILEFRVADDKGRRGLVELRGEWHDSVIEMSRGRHAVAG